jgi:DNA repair exonuclease SbcCD ATPase subunit
MTTNSPNEPTLTDVIDKLEALSQGQQHLAQEQERFSQDLEKLAQTQERFSQELERSNDRFSTYQQATQWVVQLAFTLIASATITVIITAVVKR